VKIAIIGEGIAGLAASFYLKEHAHITVFSSGQGASMAAAGMMHKFVGDTGHKSVYADEAFLASKDILERLGGDFYKNTPIIRKILSDEMKEGFSEYDEKDLTFLDDTHVKIHEGVLIDVPRYLEKLKKYLSHYKVQFIDKFMRMDDDFSAFDFVVVCAGYGIKDLCPNLKMKYLKGQAVIYENLHWHTLPLIAKGYLAPFSDKVVIGSTYERQFESVDPDYKTALKLLEEPMKTHFSPYDSQKPIGLLSGVRVAHPNFNHPKIIKKDEKFFYVTGLGSRGLLYHGLLGQILKDVLIHKKSSSVFVL
jgi:glycine/D-amino acid oxidase-like deaminating enzyme